MNFFFVQRCHFACRKLNLLVIDGVCEQHTCRVHVFLMHSCCAVILSLTSRTNFTHHAWLKNHAAHCQCLSTKHSHFIARCRTSRLTCTGTPSSLILNHSFSEHKSCGVLRPQSGALAEPRPFTHDGHSELHVRNPAQLDRHSGS